MHRILQSFLERLSERVVAISGSMVASAIESQHAVQQAEQASAVEDLARQLEADGKEHIAASLRNQISLTTADDPGALADRLIESVVVDGAVPRLEQSPAAYALPAPAKNKTRGRKGTKQEQTSETSGGNNATD